MANSIGCRPISDELWQRSKHPGTLERCCPNSRVKLMRNRLPKSTPTLSSTVGIVLSVTPMPTSQTLVRVKLMPRGLIMTVPLDAVRLV